MLWMPNMIEELACRERLQENKLAEAFQHAFREHWALIDDGEPIPGSPYSIARMTQAVPKERRKKVLQIAKEARLLVKAEREAQQADI